MIARMQKAMKEKDGGFTLVELIVVVVIIGVLAAIAVPVFLNQSTNAKKKADIAELSNAKIALSSYLADGSNTAPTQANTKNYGMPQQQGSGTNVSHTITISNWSTTNGTFTVTMTDGESKVSCTATEATAPSCA